MRGRHRVVLRGAPVDAAVPRPTLEGHYAHAAQLEPGRNEMPRNRMSQRRAFSLLEVAMASSLAAIALVGALAMLRDGLAASKTIDDRQLLTNYAVSKLEEHLALVSGSWTSGVVSGDFATDGHHEIRFTVSRSDAVVDGGMVM